MDLYPATSLTPTRCYAAFDVICHYLSHYLLRKVAMQLSYLYSSKTTQDGSPFSIFHITDEVWLHLPLMDKFIVANHCPNFLEDYTIKCSQYLEKHERTPLPKPSRKISSKWSSILLWQNRSAFCIFHIMNEILQHPEIIDTFLVGNHWHNF